MQPNKPWGATSTQTHVACFSKQGSTHGPAGGMQALRYIARRTHFLSAPVLPFRHACFVFILNAKKKLQTHISQGDVWVTYGKRRIFYPSWFCSAVGARDQLGHRGGTWAGLARAACARDKGEECDM